MIIFDEEKIILCPFIEERFWILYQVRRLDFIGGDEEGWGSKNYKEGIIMWLTKELN